jgi:hypothetical protein
MKTLLKFFAAVCIAVMTLLIGGFIVEYFYPRHNSVLCDGGGFES